MKKIFIDNQTYQLPEKWEEVDSERLPRLLQLVYMTPETGDMYHELIQVALNVRSSTWQKLMRKHFGTGLTERQKSANAALLHQLIHALRWLWTEPIQKQPFPSIIVGEQKWLLPDEGFQTMTYGELTDAYVHFMVFLRQIVPGDEHLNLLVATVCRPMRTGMYTADTTWNGDHREAYNEYIAKQRTASVNEVDYAQRMAILLYFAANLKAIMNRYAVFASEAEADTVAEEYPGQSMLKNQHLLAEKHIFGGVLQTKEANAHEVMLFLEENRKDLLARIEREKKNNERN